MTQIGISITKRCPFRGSTQEFSNVYHYTLAGGLLNGLEGLVDEMVAVEKQLHSTKVTFIRAQVWTSGGSKADNEMQFQKDLTGTGAQPQNASQDNERAFLIRWRVGKSITGKPVYLRKWYHSCGSAAGVSPSTTVLANEGALATGDRTLVAAKAEELREIGALETWNLCSESGRVAELPAECHQYLEHHQLGDQWRK